MARTIPTQISLVKLGANIFVGERTVRHKGRERLLFLIRPSMSGEREKARSEKDMRRQKSRGVDDCDQRRSRPIWFLDRAIASPRPTGHLARGSRPRPSAHGRDAAR